MTKPPILRKWRAKAWTWLEPDAQPNAAHETIDPGKNLILEGGGDAEGRFVVLRPGESEEPALWVGDRRHWTEVPPRP
jgi:hypothetical protein